MISGQLDGKLTCRATVRERAFINSFVTHTTESQKRIYPLKRLRGDAAINHRYAFMEGRLANHKSVAGDSKELVGYTRATHARTHTQIHHKPTPLAHTWIRKKENDALDAGW